MDQPTPQNHGRRHRSRSSSPDSRRSKKQKKHRRRERSPSMSSSSSRHHSKKHRKSHKKRSKHKKQKKSRRRERSSSSDLSEPAARNIPPGAHELASALTNLFASYPAMTSMKEGGIPLIFVQLGNGTEFNLSSMPDRKLASLLEDLFKSLAVHGMEMKHDSWCWLPDSRKRDELALLRLVRALLAGVGISLEAFRQRRLNEAPMQRSTKEQKQAACVANVPDDNHPSEDVIDVAHQKRVERMTSQLLARFDPQNLSSSTLATELEGICNLLMEGESVQLDGLENEKLKASLVQLFDLSGMELVEMDDADEDDDNETEEGGEAKKSYGYALPEAAHDGPAPMGTIAAAQAAKRARQHASSASAEKVDDSGREEWMTTPGQHDFLKGIQSKSLQNRTFKNERNRGQAVSQSKDNVAINPEVLAEVSAIQQAYAESRGPSLLDAHRQSQKEAKESASKEWTWNRDKNLDDGRRVDKNALHMVLGGAKTELASKFQGSLGR
eukprot:scaffold56243_cov77-Cyclotella_meneghiniana.AAC.5